MLPTHEGKSSASVLLSHPTPSHNAEVLLQQGTGDRSGAPFLHLAQTHRAEAQVAGQEYWALSALALTYSYSRGSMLAQASQKDHKLPSTPQVEQGCHSKRSSPLPLPTALEQWLGDCSQEDWQALGIESFPKRTDFIWNRAWGSSSLRMLSKQWR